MLGLLQPTALYVLAQSSTTHTISDQEFDMLQEFEIPDFRS